MLYLTDYVYFNNSNLANAITEFNDLTKTYEFKEFDAQQNEHETVVTFDAPDWSHITRFDLAVMDAFFTAQLKREIITPEMIANIIACKEVSLEKGTSSKITEICESINRISQIKINIIRHDIKLNKMEAYNGYLLPINFIQTKSKVNKTDKIVYQLNDSLPMYDYASDLGKLVRVYADYLTFTNTRENTPYLMIKHEIAKKLQTVKDAHKDGTAIRLMYGYNNGSFDLALKAGLVKSDYANEQQWQRRCLKFHHQVENILSQFVENCYIENYIFIKQGKRVIGAQIEFTNDKGLQKIKQMERIIDSEYPNNTFIQKTKKAIKTVYLFTKILFSKTNSKKELKLRREIEEV